MGSFQKYRFVNIPFLQKFTHSFQHVHGGGDDLAKSPHLARIANSVYRHMCPNIPTCRSFYMSVSVSVYIISLHYIQICMHELGQLIMIFCLYVTIYLFKREMVLLLK